MEMRLGGRARRNLLLKACKFKICQVIFHIANFQEKRERIENWGKDDQNLPPNEANYPAAPENGQKYSSNSNELKAE